MIGYSAEGTFVADDIKQDIYDAIAAELDAEPVDYDGVQGSLPPWVPEAWKQEFVIHRERLLSKYSIDQLKAYLRAYEGEWLGSGSMERPHQRDDPRHGCCYRAGPRTSEYYPLGIEDSLDSLCWLQHCISLGEVEGLRHMAGDYAVRGHENEKSSVSGADITNKKAKAARDFCTKKAAEWWADEESRGEQITRIGEVSESLWRQLPNNSLWQPKTHETVKGWLKRAEKQGNLRIPKEASKHGAPKK